MNQLRDYQQHAVDAAINSDNKGLIVAPTGSGKSHIIAGIVQQCDMPIMIISHVKEIIQQDFNKLCAIGIIPAVYSASLNSKRLGHVTIGQVQSLYRNLEALAELNQQKGLILVDEAHRIPAKAETMYQQVIGALSNWRLLGLTATPYRLGGGCMVKAGIFDKVNYKINAAELVTKGHLAELTYRSSRKACIDTAKLTLTGGEFDSIELEQAAVEVTGEAIRDLVGRAELRNHWLIFGASVAHCELICNKLNDSGVKAGIVTGAMSMTERDQVINDFKVGHIRALVNCQVLTTGFDFPAIDLVVLLTSTTSPVKYCQILGRGMRPFAGKDDCLVLDYGENIIRFGFDVDNIIVPNGAKETKRKRFKVCPKCESCVPLRVYTCPCCGHAWERHPRVVRANGEPYGDAELDAIKITGNLRKISGAYFAVTQSRSSGQEMITIRLNTNTGVVTFYCCYGYNNHSGKAHHASLELLKHWGIEPRRGFPIAEVCRLLQCKATPSWGIIEPDGNFFRLKALSWDTNFEAVDD